MFSTDPTESAQKLIATSQETKETLSNTKDMSVEVMHKTTFMATKTKLLISDMDEIIALSAKNTELRSSVEESVHALSSDAQKLENELNKFQI